MGNKKVDFSKITDEEVVKILNDFRLKEKLGIIEREKDTISTSTLSVKVVIPKRFRKKVKKLIKKIIKNH